MKIMYRIHKFNRTEHMSKEEEKDEKEIFSVSIISNYGSEPLRVRRRIYNDNNSSGGRDNGCR